MTNIYQIPESYRAYCTDRAVRTAVDHILAESDKLGVPSDIEWDELPKFHRAVLSAHQVRCEYANYLIDLWEHIWQPALANCGFDATHRTIADTESWRGMALDTYTVWNNGTFLRVFDIGDDSNFTLALGTCDEADGQIWLSLSFWNEPDGLSRLAQLDLGNGWEEMDEEGVYVWTRIRLAPIGDDGTVDLTPILTVAADALAAIGASLPA